MNGEERDSGFQVLDFRQNMATPTSPRDHSHPFRAWAPLLANKKDSRRDAETQRGGTGGGVVGRMGGCVAWLDDTNIKVLEIAMEQLAHGSSAEEIYEQHWGYLSLAQIHAALTYYYDNRAVLDQEIDQQLADFDRRRRTSLDSPAPSDKPSATSNFWPPSTNGRTWRIAWSTCRGRETLRSIATSRALIDEIRAVRRRLGLGSP